MSKTLAFYKPYEVLCQFTDASGRPTLKDFIPLSGVYAAGRLDYRSEGLLILTDDGELSHRITDPRFEHAKTYLAQVEGLTTPPALERLRSEILLADQQNLPLQAEAVPAPPLAERPVPVRNYHPTSWIKLILHEGRKHQVRRMTAAVGLPTLRLVRFAIGGISLEGLQPGGWRQLTKLEIGALMHDPR